MRKFELLALKCNMCGWQWEITPQEKNDDVFCNKCGSDDFSIKKQNLKMLKKNGKFLTDIGFGTDDNTFQLNDYDDFSKKFSKPLAVIKHDDLKITEDMTDKDRISLLGRIDTLRSKLINEIKFSDDSSFNKI